MGEANTHMHICKRKTLFCTGEGTPLLITLAPHVPKPTARLHVGDTVKTQLC